jgi:GGDEF domain-containing protein
MTRVAGNRTDVKYQQLNEYPDHNFDELVTALPTGAEFRHQVEAKVRSARDRGRFTGVISLRLGGLEQVSARFGRGLEFFITREVFYRVMSVLPPENVLGRSERSGEFLVALDPFDEMGTALQFCERLRREADTTIKLFPFKEPSIILKVGIGLSIYPTQADSAEALLHIAMCTAERICFAAGDSC